MHVIATAGHVDHGKSTLVRVLTGTDPDRLAEEKERGLTIDLGFAFSKLPSGRDVSFIDVPGHVRFLKNMLAGVGAVDACMFVVAAPEGWKPQSEEHLRILDLLGITHGIVALTQVGLVDDELRELAIMDVEERTHGSFLEDAPIVPIDSITGEGLDDLKAALDELTANAPTAENRQRPRLWIDRAFGATGAGAVVTGTLTGGEISRDDELAIEPGGERVRVRGIQSQGQPRKKIGPGHRVALNLTGDGAGDLRRGQAVVFGAQWHLTDHVDAELNVLPSLDHEISRRGAYAMYLGAGEFPARLRVLGPSALLPGETGAVRLFFGTQLPLLPGDRFILREFGRDETVGGGQILDVDPLVKAALATPDRSVDRVIAERGWVTADHLERLTGERREPQLGPWIATEATIHELLDEVAGLVDGADDLGLDTAQLSERQRLALDLLDDVHVEEGRARPADKVDVLADHPLIALLAAEPFSPPAPEAVSGDVLRALAQRGTIVQSDGIYFAASAIDLAAHQVAVLLSNQPDGVTMAEIRDQLGTTRKFALPLIGHLDATGVTRRRGDLRIGGPRLPALD
jgi:selenocysteine-specific elongation factor